MLHGAIKNFIKESNKIEGIYAYNVEKQFKLHMDFFSLKILTIQDVCNFVNQTAGDKAVLRQNFGQNVTVGDHVPMLGGPSVKESLQKIIDEINASDNILDNIQHAYDLGIAGGKWIRSFDEEKVVQVRSAAIKALHNTSGPFQMHNKFVHLHPFMDGNGRSGRAIWARQMINHMGYDFNPGFLHVFYYQTLGFVDKML